LLGVLSEFSFSDSLISTFFVNVLVINKCFGFFSSSQLNSNLFIDNVLMSVWRKVLVLLRFGWEFEWNYLVGGANKMNKNGT